MKILCKSVLFVLMMATCFSCKHEVKTDVPDSSNESFTTPLGKVIQIAQPGKKAVEQYEVAKREFEGNPDDIENLIWYGRRTAYLAKYEDAIQIYSQGINKYPADPRLYRHRGHRYISIRKYDEAIADFNKAVSLIKDSENEIEPDGIPNALNIPISTLHGNIYYHLGLAYHLNHEYEKAYQAYLKCRTVGDNDDNIVSSTHWMYSIQSRIENPDVATTLLEPIHDSMNIIENISYYNLCKFYKGLITIDSISATPGNPSSDAVLYGLANWLFVNGRTKEAQQAIEEILEGDSWNSFGYIAAESDYIEYFNAGK
jgi:tetratricopeptide (TPR) repeat protein